MHSIERYGIVALLFLVVTVVAVLMWDGGKKKKPDQLAGTNPAPLVDTSAPRALDRASRLELVAQGQPGPLVRETAQREPALQTPEAPESGTLQPVGLSADDHDDAPVKEPASYLQPGETLAPEPRPIAAAPAASSGRTYVVKAGDTLSEIAQRELGSSRRWQEIVSLNAGLDPARMRAGKTIRLPGDARTPASAEPKSEPKNETKAAPTARTTPGGVKAAPTSAGRTHKVGKGESLWKIAERTLGDGKRWREIAALNPKVDPDKLAAGTVLKLPGAPASAARVSEAPKAKQEPVVAALGDERPARRGSKVK